jgi:hypothetical protein
MLPAPCHSGRLYCLCQRGEFRYHINHPSGVLADRGAPQAFSESLPDHDQPERFCPLLVLELCFQCDTSVLPS